MLPVSPFYNAAQSSRATETKTKLLGLLRNVAHEAEGAAAAASGSFSASFPPEKAIDGDPTTESGFWKSDSAASTHGRSTGTEWAAATNSGLKVLGTGANLAMVEPALSGTEVSTVADDLTLGNLNGQGGWATPAGAGTPFAVTAGAGYRGGYGIVCTQPAGPTSYSLDRTVTFPAGPWTFKVRAYIQAFVGTGEELSFRLRVGTGGTIIANAGLNSRTCLTNGARSLQDIPLASGGWFTVTMDGDNTTITACPLRIWVDGVQVFSATVNMTGVDRIQVASITSGSSMTCGFDDLRFGGSISAEGTSILTSDLGADPVSARAELTATVECPRAEGVIAGSFHGRSTGSGWASLRDASARTLVGQTFQPSETTVLDAVWMHLQRQGTPQGNVWVELRDSAGLIRYARTNSIPTSNLALVPGYGLTGTEGERKFEFPYAPTLTSGVTYMLVLAGDFAIDGVNYIQASVDLAAGYASGAAQYFSGAAWSAQAFDFNFVCMNWSQPSRLNPTSNHTGNMSIQHAADGHTALSQRFKVPYSHTLNHIQAYISVNVASTMGQSRFWCELHADDGTGLPGALIAMSSYHFCNEITWTSPRLFSLSFPTAPWLDKALNYHLVFRADYSDSSVVYLQLGVSAYSNVELFLPMEGSGIDRSGNGRDMDRTDRTDELFPVKPDVMEGTRCEGPGGYNDMGLISSATQSPAVLTALKALTTWDIEFEWKQERSLNADNRIYLIQTTNAVERVLFQLTSTGSVRIVFRRASTDFVLGSSSGVVVANKWHRLRFTYDAATQTRTIYVDGVSVATDTGQAHPATSTADFLRINGAGATGRDFFMRNFRFRSAIGANYSHQGSLAKGDGVTQTRQYDRDLIFTIMTEQKVWTEFEEDFSFDNSVYPGYSMVDDGSTRANVTASQYTGAERRYWRMRARLRKAPAQVWGASWASRPIVPSLLSWSNKVLFATAKSLTVDLGQTRTFNRLDLYAHPTEGGARKFRIYTSPDASAWTLLTNYDTRTLEARKRGGAATISARALQPIAWWKFDGDLLDASGNGFHLDSALTAFSSDGTNPSKVVPVQGTHCWGQFNSGSGAVQGSGLRALLNGSSFCNMFWVWVPTSSSGNETVHTFESSPFVDYSILRILSGSSNSNCIQWAMVSGGGAPEGITANAVRGAWNLVVMNLQYGIGRYLHVISQTGVISTSTLGSSCAPSVPAGGFFFGGASNSFRGYLDNCKVFLRYLSLAEIWEEFSSLPSVLGGVSTLDGTLITSGDYAGLNLASEVSARYVKVEVLDNVDEYARLCQVMVRRSVDLTSRLGDSCEVGQSGDYAQRWVQARRMDFTLRNEDYALSSENPSGAYYGQLGGGMEFRLFSGYTDATDWVPHGVFYCDKWEEQSGSPMIRVSASDGVRLLNRTIAYPFQTGKTIGEVVEKLANLGGIPSQDLIIEDTCNRLAFVPAGEANVWEEIKKLSQAGGLAACWFDAQGYLHFKPTGISGRDADLKAHVGATFARVHGPAVYDGSQYLYVCHTEMSGANLVLKLDRFDLNAGTWSTISTISTKGAEHGAILSYWKGRVFILDFDAVTSTSGTGEKGTGAADLYSYNATEGLVLRARYLQPTAGANPYFACPTTIPNKYSSKQVGPYWLSMSAGFHETIAGTPKAKIGIAVNLDEFSFNSFHQDGVFFWSQANDSSENVYITGQSSGDLYSSLYRHQFYNSHLDYAIGSTIFYTPFTQRGAREAIYTAPAHNPNQRILGSYYEAGKLYLLMKVSKGSTTDPLRGTTYDYDFRLANYDLTSLAFSEGFPIITGAKNISQYTVQAYGSFEGLTKLGGRFFASIPWGDLVNGGWFAPLWVIQATSGVATRTDWADATFGLGPGTMDWSFSVFAHRGLFRMVSFMGYDVMQEFSIASDPELYGSAVVSISGESGGLLRGATLQASDEVAGASAVINSVAVSTKPYSRSVTETVYSGGVGFGWYYDVHGQAPITQTFKADGFWDPATIACTATAAGGAVFAYTILEVGVDFVTISWGHNTGFPYVAGSSITNLQVTAQRYTQDDGYSATVIADPRSVARFKERKLSVSNDYVSDIIGAALLALALGVRTSTKPGRISGLQAFGHLNLELFDRVTLSDPFLFVTADYYVAEMKADPQKGIVSLGLVECQRGL